LWEVLEIIMTREDLINLSKIPPSNISVAKSLEARGYPYYGNLKSSYPIHWASFSAMHGRVRDFGLDCDFPRNVDGFIDFILYVGPVPGDMIRPTLGRSDHSIGYLKGNFKWQESSDNTSESATRNKTVVKIQECRLNRLEDLVSSLGDKVEIDSLFTTSHFRYKKDLYRLLRSRGYKISSDYKVASKV
jgi:hypothetical protein